MISAIREWLEETHSDTVELTRHFLARFFDTETGASAGDWQKLAIGIVATLASAGIVGFQTYWARFNRLQNPDISTPSLYHAAVRGDLILMLAIVMAITAVLALLEWRSLFPSLQDYLALSGYPVSARQIFVSKFIALLLLFGAFVLALCGPLAGMFTAVIAGRWQENPSGGVMQAANFAALAGGCAFVFFVLLAIQGLLLNLVPGRWFLRVSLAAQGALFMATVAALPLAGRQPAGAVWWPPVWFIRLWEAIVLGRPAAAAPALAALGISAALAVFFYLLSYHRYRRLLLEAPARQAAGHWSGWGARLLEWWVPNPREQAAFAFLWKTLARSWVHRLLLLAYAGLAAGWVIQAALDAPPVSLHDEGMYGLMALASPLALAALMIIGLRYLFTLPVTLKANWMFQTADEEGRAAWLAAVERFVITCGIAPVFLAGLPAAIVVLGTLRGIAATALAVLVALLVFERLFRDWRKLPFTCSYLPGKRPFWMLVFRAGLAAIYFAAVPPILLSASGQTAAFLAVFTGLAMWWLRWRAIRRVNWENSALLWQETPDADVEALHLQPAEKEIATSAAPREREMFTGGMVASRGILPQAWEEEIAEERRHPLVLLATAWRDVRFGCRMIARDPLFSLVIVLTLTVGIGINASVFTVVDGIMLRPHVYKDPANFVRVVPESRLQVRPRRVSYQEYRFLRDNNRTLRQLAALQYTSVTLGDDDPGATVAIEVSCNFFLVEGLDRAAMGRLIDEGDCGSQTAVPAAVISAKTWRQRFGSDPHVVGRMARVNNRFVNIVGVAPDLTTGWLTPPDIWLPFTAQPYLNPTQNGFTDESLLWLTLAGRLKPGFSPSQVRADIESLERQQDLLHPGRYTAVTTTDGSWLEEFELYWTGRDVFLLAFFLGAFTLVLLIACANVATLLLSRAASRRREIAVRLSLGAPRVRLVRMLVTESLILAGLAGVASFWLIQHVPRPLYHYLAPRAPDYPMNPDWRVFAYVSAIVFASGILSGMAPALESVRVDLASSLKGYSSLLQGGVRVRAALVSAQVAMSMVLLVSAALFGKTEQHNLHANPGYLPQKVVVAGLNFPENTSLADARVRLDAIERRMRSLPGAHSAAFSDEIPMIGRTTLELRPPMRQDAVQPVDIYTGSPGFFDTLGVPIVRGREFQEADGAAIVVSRELARLFWPGVDPVGRTLTLNGTSQTVVGVAADVDPVRFGGSDNPPLYLLRRPRSQANVLSVRFDGDPMQGALAVRMALRELDPNLEVVARGLQSWIDQVTETLWNVVSLIVVLGLVATTLATIGIYGAVSFAVNQQKRDLGIRLALGASRFDIVRAVLISGGRPVARGLFFGLWLSVGLAASLRENMQGTPLRLDSADPLLYGGAVLLLAVAALLAMVGPARRGSNCDPLEALRCD